MRVILDTNVLISALVFDNQIEALLKYIIASENITVYSSNEHWREITDKFYSGRVERISKKSKRNISKNIIEEFLLLVEHNFLFIDVTSKVDICRDSDDNMLLALAQDARADYIITGDKDLLVIEFYGKTKIATPGEFMSL